MLQKRFILVVLESKSKYKKNMPLSFSHGKIPVKGIFIQFLRKKKSDFHCAFHADFIEMGFQPFSTCFITKFFQIHKVIPGCIEFTG